MRSSWLEDNISSKAWFDVRRPFAGQTFASQLLRCLCRFTSLTWLGRQGMLWTKPFPFSWAKSLADEYLTNGFISESSRLMQPCWQHGPTKDVEKLFKTSWANTTSCRLWWSHVIKLGFTPELSNKAVKLYRTPHVDEGSLVASDEADRGQVSNVAAKLVMKFMWLGRVSRPDLLVAINACAGHITKWTTNDDKRMTRLAGYVAATLNMPRGSVQLAAPPLRRNL